MSQRFLTGKIVYFHRVKSITPIQAGVAVHSGKPLCHPATARIAMSAHQSCAPTITSQQAVTTKPFHRHQTIAELHHAVDKQGSAMGISDKRRRQGADPSNEGSKPSTSRATNRTSGEQLGSRPVAD